MLLSNNEKQNILLDFPNIKLSYENITHKKVYNSDMILVIPDGKKCFAWFTYINDKPSCLIMELACDKNINDIIKKSLKYFLLQSVNKASH